MGVFDRQTATAIKLIAKNGEMVTWRNYGETRESDEPWNPSPGKAYVDHRVKVVFLPTGGSLHQLIKAMANSDVQSGNELGYMGRVKFKPSDIDEVIRGNGDKYRIKSIDPIDPNGEGVILYTIEFTA